VPPFNAIVELTGVAVPAAVGLHAFDYGDLPRESATKYTLEANGRDHGLSLFYLQNRRTNSGTVHL
jgi:hypothetical protein